MKRETRSETERTETAAIYARCSNPSQSASSIDGQVASCRRYAQAHEMVVYDEYVFLDEGMPGQHHDRSGLESLLDAAEEGPFDVVLIDDLSRLSRDNSHVLAVLRRLMFAGVRALSVDGRPHDGGGIEDEKEIANEGQPGTMRRGRQ